MPRNNVDDEPLIQEVNEEEFDGEEENLEKPKNRKERRQLEKESKRKKKEFKLNRRNNKKNNGNDSDEYDEREGSYEIEEEDDEVEKKTSRARQAAVASQAKASGGLNYTAVGILLLFVLPMILGGIIQVNCINFIVMHNFYPQIFKIGAGFHVSSSCYHTTSQRTCSSMLRSS